MTYSNFLSRALSGLFFMQLIFSGPLALAELSKDGRDHLIQQLTEEAKSTCAAPQKIHSHSADILDTAIRHRVDRTNGLLTSVFLELFILPNSSYVDMAFCMAIFLNIPMHHYWDSAFTNGKLLLAAEKEEANIPSYRIRDIDAEGTWLTRRWMAETTTPTLWPATSNTVSS